MAMICQLRDAEDRMVDAAQDMVELLAVDDDAPVFDDSDAVYQAWADEQEF